MKKTGLVLEGGASRGIYTAGVLDVLLENEIYFDGCMGVSAGAIHGISYVSRQAGRSYCFSVKYCKDPRFMGLRSLLTTGDICGAKFCFYDIPDSLVPFAHESFENSTTEFYCVCTDVKTGEAVYRKCETMHGNEVEWVRASASMPIVSRNVEIDGREFLDGGIADSIPFRKFMDMGYNKTLVVCTQHDGYRKEKESISKLMPLRYGKNSPLTETMQNRPAMYNAQLDDLKQAEQNGEVLVIRPSEPLHIGRVEHDPEVIRRVYLLGRKDATAMLAQLKMFISS